MQNKFTFYSTFEHIFLGTLRTLKKDKMATKSFPLRFYRFWFQK